MLRYQFTDSKSAFKENADYALTILYGDVQNFARYVEECRLYITRNNNNLRGYKDVQEIKIG